MRGCALLSCALGLQAVLLAGCASSSRKDLDKLRQRLEELAQREAASQRQVEELNNRLFLIEDRLESRHLAAQRSDGTPRLPVIRIRPDASTDEDRQAEPRRAARLQAPDPHASVSLREPTHDADGDDVDDDAGGGPGDGRRSLVAAREVRYGGVASSGGGPRPVLRLHAGPGSRSGGSARQQRLDDGPDPEQVREKLPVVPIAGRTPPAGRRGANANDPAAMTMYKQAMEKYQAGRYEAAAAAFRRFLERHAQHAYTDNSLYWIGECFYGLKKYRVALQMFRRVVEEHPNGNKAPDALLKMGYCYIRLEERANARSVLAQVVEIFPKSNSARLASSALTRLQ